MTPEQQAQKLLIMFDYCIDSCIKYCENKIKYDVTPEFYKLVKKELLNNENKFCS